MPPLRSGTHKGKSHEPVVGLEPFHHSNPYIAPETICEDSRDQERDIDPKQFRATVRYIGTHDAAVRRQVSQEREGGGKSKIDSEI